MAGVDVLVYHELRAGVEGGEGGFDIFRGFAALELDGGDVGGDSALLADEDVDGDVVALALVDFGCLVGLDIEAGASGLLELGGGGGLIFLVLFEEVFYAPVFEEGVSGGGGGEGGEGD